MTEEAQIPAFGTALGRLALARGEVDRSAHFRNDEEWLKHIDISMNGADIPQVSFSPVTITRWQPEERTY